MVDRGLMVACTNANHSIKFACAAASIEIASVDKVFPKATLHAEVVKIAKRMSCVSAGCLRWNKRSVNQAFETMGLRYAIMYGAEASAIMDSLSSPEADRSDEIHRGHGLSAALEWRAAQFAPFE
jgi:hypothetical protein